ncbi:MAG: Jag N-terminal domain-containing protein [Elusimicrobia bacterium]|nr:Jag N-terminal domain-containing protein [Elusimicrobiota bacterium]MDE2237802.1 Jag N-terminal domain-containing protein [Elusimicrobiota bacterium]MDE2425501.1 Jag N-terminal domain-containing protein [Elusimicrobiota bacterium]
MQPIEQEGDSVAQAVEAALRRSGLQRDQVEVEVLSEGSAGFLGLGAKPARVRLAEKELGAAAAASACALASQLLQEIIELSGLSLDKPSAAWDPIQQRVRCRLEGADAGLLVGDEARGLEALQLLVTLMAARRSSGAFAVQVDALGYRERREGEILAQAEGAARQAKATGRPVRLPPMDASARRLIHRSLAGRQEIETASEGEGAWRKVVVRPRKR